MSGQAWLFLFCLFIGWLVARRTSGSRGAAAGRMVSISGHGHDRATVATHEAGHAVAARAVGGRVRSATMTDNSGLVRATVPDARAAIVFLAAGAIAAGTNEGAGADQDLIRRTLREFPSRERGQVRRECDREAHRIVASRAAEIRRDAARLNQRGRL